MSLSKLPQHRNDTYLEFVRSRPCWVTESTHNIVAHHVRIGGTGGTGLKPSDYLCLPLRADVHTRLHSYGEKRFWSDQGVDPFEGIAMNLLIYLAKYGRTEKNREQVALLCDVIECLRI